MTLIVGKNVPLKLFIRRVRALRTEEETAKKRTKGADEKSKMRENGKPSPREYGGERETDERKRNMQCKYRKK